MEKYVINNSGTCCNKVLDHFRQIGILIMSVLATLRSTLQSVQVVIMIRQMSHADSLFIRCEHFWLINRYYQ